MFFESEELTPEQILLKNSSEARYNSRQNNSNSKIEHRILWILHNVVIHPLLGVFPNQVTVDLHGLTSDWLNIGRAGNLGWVKHPKIENRKAWMKHNVIAHIGIGLFPCKATFDYHDKTSKQMNVKGWV